MALITTLTEEPTGTYVASLPTLAFSLHSVGVSGYENRWVSRDLTQAAGDVLPEWAATNGVKLTGSSSIRYPSVVTSSGFKALSFNGVDDGLSNTALPTAQRTVILVARVTAADGVNTPLIGGADDDIQLIRNGSNQIGVFAPGTGVSASTATETGSTWHVFGLRLDATEATAWRDGVKLAAAASTGAGLTGLRLPIASGAFGKIEALELVTYPTALADADMMTIKTELKKTYTMIP